MAYTFKNLVNKHDKYEDPDIEQLVVESSNPKYARLDQIIYGNSASNFIGIFETASQTGTEFTEYTIDYDTSIITFTIEELPNELYAIYWGGGSIIWANDITTIQQAINTTDAAALYIDGTKAMTGNLVMGTIDINQQGQVVNNFHNITNVNTVDGVILRSHTHSGGTSGVQISTAGIANSAITNDLIRNTTIGAEKLVGVGAGIKIVTSGSAQVLAANVDNVTVKTDTSSQLSVGTIGPENIAAGAINSPTKIGTNVIVGSNIAENTIPASKLTGAAVVIETYKNGSNWYRKWSDGWIEQGGDFLAPANTSNVPLNTPFTTTSYQVFATQTTNRGGDEATTNLQVPVRTTSYFTLVAFLYERTSPLMWIAEGY